MIVWSYGGGTQSAAIAVLILQGRLPRPDLIVMADTGREVQDTWDYLEQVVRPAGLNVQIASHSLATVDMYAHNGDLLIPAYTRQNGSVGKLPTFCSDKWKQHVVRRWLRQQGVVDCDVWLGISIDEAERMKPSGLKWYRHAYPLIETLPMPRHRCVSVVEGYGWPTPPKSRCWMCPNQGPRSWQQMRDNRSDDFRRAVELEKELQERDPDIYLHPLAIPLEEAVQVSNLQPELFDGCDSGYCWT